MMVLFPATKVLKKMHIYKKNAVFLRFYRHFTAKNFHFSHNYCTFARFFAKSLILYHYANYNN